jgi:hypothetical protein
MQYYVYIYLAALHNPARLNHHLLIVKNKALIIVAIVFFVIVNTHIFWEPKLGFWILPFTLVLLLTFFVLAAILVWQCWLVIREKFRNRSRLLTIAVLAVVLGVIYIEPRGFISYEMLEGEGVFLAENEGAVNCTTTLKLLEDFTFRERTICFRVTEVTGTFRVSRDTIYFENVKMGRGVDEYYSFGVIKPNGFTEDKKQKMLILYKSAADTSGGSLWITNNKLLNLPPAPARR